jgi:hypothetical protein
MKLMIKLKINLQLFFNNRTKRLIQFWDNLNRSHWSLILKILIVQIQIQPVYFIETILLIKKILNKREIWSIAKFIIEFYSTNVTVLKMSQRSFVILASKILMSVIKFDVVNIKISFWDINYSKKVINNNVNNMHVRFASNDFLPNRIKFK